MICDEPQFIVYGSANGKVIIPDYLNSGNMLVVEPENCEAGTGSIVMTGGVLRMCGEEDAAYEMQQTGIITALGDPGAVFCERLLSLILAQFARVMIMYPTWGWDREWPSLMRNRGFTVYETRVGHSYALAVGPGRKLAFDGWLKDAFYGINALLVGTHGEPCRLEMEIRARIERGGCIADPTSGVGLKTEWHERLHNNPGSATQLLDGAAIYATWGGPDCNNLVVNSISDADSVVTQIRQCVNVLADGLGFSVYEAPSVDSFTDILEQVTFPDFLKWVPVPGDWTRVC